MGHDNFLRRTVQCGVALHESTAILAAGYAKALEVNFTILSTYPSTITMALNNSKSDLSDRPASRSMTFSSKPAKNTRSALGRRKVVSQE